MKQHTACNWRSVAIFLAALVCAQFLLLVSILDSKHPMHLSSLSNTDEDLPKLTEAKTKLKSYRAETKNQSFSLSETKNIPEGVAATVMLSAPKWFHRRYTSMIQNALANIPATWHLQIFSNEEWVQSDVLPLHPGLQRLRSHPRIIWTPMPTELTKKRPKEVMKSKWLWKSVATENVLFFSGNGVFCTNSKTSVKDFLHYDFVGVPWSDHDGIGGDASTHSFRKRSDMIRILEKYPPLEEMEEQDYRYFPKYLVQEGTSKMADVNTTILFGGVTDDPDSAPFVVSGTQDRLSFNTREHLLHVCPELKIIFPSLHEPACFGAHPNGEKCKSTICALKDPLPSSGC